MDSHPLMPSFGTQLFILFGTLALLHDTYQLVFWWVESAR